MSSVNYPGKPSSFDRRQFMKVSSLAAVAVSLPTSLLKAATAQNPSLLPILAVGFTDNVPTKVGAGVRLRSASDLLAGDPTFLGTGASIRISTFSRSPRFRDLAGGVDLNVVFPSFGFQPDEYPQFQAWGFRHLDGVQSSSSSLRFTVPVSNDGVQMVFRRPSALRARPSRGVQPTAPAPIDDHTLVLNPGIASNSMKLQQGVYVIALRESEDERVPDWSDQVLYRGEHGLALNSAANFTYLIATVDHAK